MSCECERFVSRLRFGDLTYDNKIGCFFPVGFAMLLYNIQLLALGFH